MVLTLKQIKAIKKIINKHFNAFILFTLGAEHLSDSDRKDLEKQGFFDNGVPNENIFHDAFKIGRTRSLANEVLPKLSYKQWKEYILGMYLDDKDKQSLDNIDSSTSHYLGSLKEKVTNRILTTIIDANKEATLSNIGSPIGPSYARADREAVDIKKLADELEESTKDINRDWQKVVVTELNSAHSQGSIQSIVEDNQDKDPKDILVYCVGPLDAATCQYCKRSYHDGGSFKVYRLSELLANGTNIGLKAGAWRAVVPPMHPNCYSRDTQVLTNNGWMYFENLIGNEKFLSVDLMTGRAEYINAIKQVKYKVNEIYSYTNQRFSLNVSSEHDHVIVKPIYKGRTKIGWKTPQFVSNEKVFNSGDNAWRFLNTIPNWVGTRPKSIRGFETHHFVQLLAWYLSEGNLDIRANITIHQTKTDNRAIIENLLKDMQLEYYNYKEKDRFTIHGRQELYNYLKQFGKSHEKFIPSEILELDKEYLELFLTTYIAGDGNIRAGKLWKNHQFPDSRTISTSSSKMMSHLCEILLKLGKRPSVIYKDPTTVKHKNGIYTAKHGQWYINELRIQHSVVDTMEKKIIPYDDYVYCVELEKYNTLFVMHNGKVTLSGNCRHRLVELPQGYTLDDTGKVTFVSLKHHELNKPLKKSFAVRKLQKGILGSEKSGHKYIKRTGAPGHYQYWYKDTVGKLYASDKTPQSHLFEKIEENRKKVIVKPKEEGINFINAPHPKSYRGWEQSSNLQDVLIHPKYGSLMVQPSADNKFTVRHNGGVVKDKTGNIKFDTKEQATSAAKNYVDAIMFKGLDSIEVRELLVKGGLARGSSKSGHKYIKRTGGTGNYHYWYKDAKGRLYEGKNAPEDHTQFNPELPAHENAPSTQDYIAAKDFKDKILTIKKPAKKKITIKTSGSNLPPPLEESASSKESVNSTPIENNSFIDRIDFSRKLNGMRFLKDDKIVGGMSIELESRPLNLYKITWLDSGHQKYEDSHPNKQNLRDIYKHALTVAMNNYDSLMSRSKYDMNEFEEAAWLDLGKNELKGKIEKLASGKYVYSKHGVMDEEGNLVSDPFGVSLAPLDYDYSVKSYNKHLVPVVEFAYNALQNNTNDFEEIVKGECGRKGTIVHKDKKYFIKTEKGGNFPSKELAEEEVTKNEVTYTDIIYQAIPELKEYFPSKLQISKDTFLQDWIEDFQKFEGEEGYERLNDYILKNIDIITKLALTNFLLDNRDRHMDNFGIDKTNDLKLIDEGYTIKNREGAPDRMPAYTGGLCSIWLQEDPKWNSLPINALMLKEFFNEDRKNNILEIMQNNNISKESQLNFEYRWETYQRSLTLAQEQNSNLSTFLIKTITPKYSQDYQKIYNLSIEDKKNNELMEAYKKVLKYKRNLRKRAEAEKDLKNFHKKEYLNRALDAFYGADEDKIPTLPKKN